jgi:hypothetical protein
LKRTTIGAKAKLNVIVGGFFSEIYLLDMTNPNPFKKSSVVARGDHLVSGFDK